jgi:hypothetical protein
LGRGGLIRATRRWVSLAIAGLIALLAGCAARTSGPQLITPAAPGGFHTVRYPRVGFQLALPRDWPTVPAHAPMVALAASDQAVIALWRYPRKAPPPRTPAELHQAALGLIAAARARSTTLHLISSDAAPVDGFPAVELQTVQRIGRQPRQVRSTHVFGPGEEVVLEEYAPVSQFPGLDRSVFSEVRRSLAALRH